HAPSDVAIDVNFIHRRFRRVIMQECTSRRRRCGVRMNFLDNTTVNGLAAAAERADQSCNWPSNSMTALRNANVMGWSIPVEYGGAGLKAVESLEGHRQIATACLTTAFILSQREAAVRHLLR